MNEDWEKLSDADKDALAFRISKHISQPEQSKLPEFYRDLQADMRWRRDTEFKLLAVQLALVGVCFTLSLQAYDKGACVRIATSIASLFLVWIIRNRICEKIVAEHKEYEFLGQTAVRIWEAWGLFSDKIDDKPILSDPSRNFGKGLGYLKMISIINWATWTYTIVAGVNLLFSLHFLAWWLIRHCCHHCG